MGHIKTYTAFKKMNEQHNDESGEKENTEVQPFQLVEDEYPGLAKTDKFDSANLQDTKVKPETPIKTDKPILKQHPKYRIHGFTDYLK